MHIITNNTQKLIKIPHFLWLLIIITACSSQPATPTITSNAASTASVTLASQSRADAAEAAITLTPSTDESGGVIPGSIVDITTQVAERTPVPTATPSRVEREIDRFVQEVGLAGKTFLGFPVENWIDLGISILIILIGYQVGIRLLSGILKWVVKRTDIEFDDAFVDHIIPDLKWLVMLLLTRFAVLRLDFLSDNLRTTLDDLFFALELLLITVVAIRLVNFATQWYKNNIESEEDRSRLRPVITAGNRISLFIVLIFSLSIGMSHYGIDIGALSLMLIVLVLIVSFGAKSYLSDVIGGFIILADQPFRVHDGILLKDLDTWGDVLEIGTRTTRIQTQDNREVIVPNTKILDSQVTNYTYPNNHYRMQEDIGIAYNSDLEKAKKVIKDALLTIDKVLTDKPVDVLFNGFGDTNRKIRVRWWIADYHNESQVRDQACTLIESALNKANIDMPFTTYDLNVRMRNNEPDPGTQHDDQDNQMEST